MPGCTSFLLIYVHACINVRMCLQVWTWFHVCTYAQTWTYLCMRGRTLVRTCSYIYACTYACALHMHIAATTHIYMWLRDAKTNTKSCENRHVYAKYCIVHIFYMKNKKNVEKISYNVLLIFGLLSLTTKAATASFIAEDCFLSVCTSEYNG